MLRPATPSAPVSTAPCARCAACQGVELLPGALNRPLGTPQGGWVQAEGQVNDEFVEDGCHVWRVQQKKNK